MALRYATTYKTDYGYKDYKDKTFLNMDGNARVNLWLELKNKLKGGLGEAKKYLNQNVQDMKAKLSELKSSHVEAFRAMEDEMPIFGRAMSMIGNPYTILIAGAIAFGAALGKGMDINKTWREGMAKINVTAQLTKDELKNLSGEIDAIARRNNTPYEQVPDAFNKIISAGLSVDQSLKALEPTLKASKAGFTDVETTAKAAVSVMNSTGETNIIKIFDVLFATVNKGNAEFKDIAQYLPKIIPAARNVGVTLYDTAGAYAYLTAQGQTAEASATLLENAFKVLGDPDKVKNFKALGISIYDAKGNMRGLVPIASDLNRVLDGLTDKDRAKVLNSLGLDMEAATAFAALSQNVQKLKEDIDFTTHSQGQYNKAVDNSQTGMDSWGKIINTVKGVLNDIGDVANTVFGQIGDFIWKNKDWLEVLAIAVLGGATAWGTYALVTNAASIATTALTAAQWLLNIAMDANPIGIIVVGIGALIAGVIAAYKKFDWFRGIIWGTIEVAKLLSDVFIGLGKTIIGAFTLDADMIKKGFEQSAKAVSSIMNGGIQDAFTKGYTSQLSTAKENTAKDQTDNLYQNKPAAPGTKKPPALPGDKKDKNASGISGGQSKVITIHELNVVKGDFVSKNAELASMSPQELDRWFREMIQRAMIDLARGTA